MKKYLKVFIIVIIAVVGVGILKNMLIKMAITTVGSSVVGAPIKIRKFSLGIITQKVHIKDMAVGNPKGFPKGPLVEIPEIRVDYNIGALLTGKLHLSLVIFDLKQVVIVKDKDGNMNVDALKIAQAQEEPEEDHEKAKPKKKGKDCRS